MDIVNDPLPTLSDGKFMDNQDQCHYPTMASSSSDDHRVHTILEMLEHRRLLLERVNTCRKAAELGLHQNTLFPSPMENTTSYSTNCKELDAFNFMCRRATQSLGIKRSQSVLNVTHRGSMSMRKSSVTGGRKDFSLGRSVSDGGFFSDENGSGTLMLMEPSNRQFTTMNNGDVIPHMDIDLSLSSNNVIRLDMTEAHDLNDFKNLSNKKNSSASTKRPMSSKIVQSSMSNANNALLMGLNPGSHKPLDAQDTMNNDKHRFKKTPVLLEQLRLQRKDIIAKLESVAKKRRASLQGKFQCIEESPDQSRKLSKKKSTTSTNTSISSSPTTSSPMDVASSVMMLPHQIPPSPYFPSRVKTHWDYVLEEMRWLATDYIEERKWKRVQARVRSETIRLHFIDSWKNKSSPMTTQLPLTSPLEQRPTTIPTSSRDNLEIELSTESINETETPFRTPSTQDIDITRDIARFSSTQVESYWNTFRPQQDFSVNDQEGFTDIYNPYINLYDSVSSQGSQSHRAYGDVSKSSSNGETKDFDLSYDQITSIINCILDHMKQVTQRLHNIPNSTYIDTINQMCHPWKPYPTQVRALIHFEHAWSSHDETNISNSPGLILSGRHSCGKTATVSALLGILKSSKPHLLLCPTISMNRWKYELGKVFGSKNVITFGNQAWLELLNNFILSNEPFKGRNLIILCELTQYKRMLKELELKLNAEMFSIIFSTIVIDSRCCFPKSTAQFASLGSQSSSSPSNSTSVCQLRSCSLWNELTIDFKSYKAKRVIVEQDFHTSKPEDQVSDFDDKHRSELLSAKLTFLLNPIFQSKKGSPSKKLLSWARRHAHTHATSNDINANSGIQFSVSSSVRNSGYRTILYLLQEALVYHLQYPSNLLHPCQLGIHYSHLQPYWNIRLCSYSKTQRLLYDKVLMHVRGSLSSCNQNLKLDPEYVHRSCFLTAKAFLRLRRVCFFAGDENECLHNRIFIQPSIELAKQMIDRSGKLRELYIFLQDLLRVDISKRKKVLILASLPEIIVATSLFLNTLGIRNETVGVTTNCRRNSFERSNIAQIEAVCNGDGFVSDHNRNQHIKQISRDQTSICRFIDSSPEINENSGLDVLIGAPLSLGHHNFGLTASSADYVISIDEDWNSRGRSDIDDILMKVFLFHHGGCRPKFIKLVMENTYEQIFVSPQLINDHSIVDNQDDRELFMVKAQLPFSAADNFYTFLQVLHNLELGSSSDPCLYLKNDCSSKRSTHSDFDSHFARESVKSYVFFHGIHTYIRRSIGVNLIPDNGSPRVDEGKAYTTNLSFQDSDLDDTYDVTEQQTLGTVHDLLTYSPVYVGGTLSDLDMRTGVNTVGTDLHRQSNHSLIYDIAITPRDGKQGADKLVYFPPLFPGLLQHHCSLAANNYHEPNTKQKLCALNPQSTQSGKKRKASHGNLSSKRFRSRDVEPTAARIESFPLFDHSFTSNLPDDLLDSVDLGLLTTDDPVFDPESDIFDVDMSPTDAPISRTATIPNQEDLYEIRKLDLPTLTASLNSALEQSVQATGVSAFYDPYYDGSSNVVEEDTWVHETLFLPPILESLLVYLKTAPNKSLSFMTGILGRSNSISTIPRASKALSISAPKALEDIASQSSLPLIISDYTDPQPKLIKAKLSDYKSKLSSKLFSTGTEPSDSIGLPPGQGSNELSSGSVKASQQNQSSAKSKRHDSYSSIIYSGGHKGQPYVNFRRHVMNRLDERRGIELDENNLLLQGLQAVIAREKAVDSQTISTGGEKWILPHSMNFGPFSTGFVYSSLTKEIHSVIPKVCGIELPMGVRKTPTSSNMDSYHGKAAWCESDDLRLQMLARQFKGNWSLIRMAIMDQNQLGNDYHHHHIRSSHQCEEKWNNFIQEKQSFKEIMAGSTLDKYECRAGNSLSKSLLSTTSINDPESYSQCVQTFLKANMKRRRMQISIPGSSNLGAPATLHVVNSHPSHTQSIHDALGPLGGQTRSEMWPLQILDNIDKQHQANVGSSHLSSPGVFLRQKGSSTSPVNNHSTAHRSHSIGNGSRSPLNRTSNTTQPNVTANHTQYPNYRYPVSDTT